MYVELQILEEGSNVEIQLDTLKATLKKIPSFKTPSLDG